MQTIWRSKGYIYHRAVFLSSSWFLRERNRRIYSRLRLHRFLQIVKKVWQRRRLAAHLWGTYVKPQHDIKIAFSVLFISAFLFLMIAPHSWFYSWPNDRVRRRASTVAPRLDSTCETLCVFFQSLFSPRTVRTPSGFMRDIIFLEFADHVIVVRKPKV
jgi:hypothetical protein